MTDTELVASLRLALAQAGEAWRSQPSVLRRRLEAVLGPDAASQRAKVHLLTVAAEERVPDRIARSDGAPAQLASIADDLAATRGWTTDAASWSVATWHAALAPAEAPGPALAAPGATSLPDAPPPAVEPTPAPDRSADPAPPSSDETVLPPVPPGPPAPPAPSVSAPLPPPPIAAASPVTAPPPPGLPRPPLPAPAPVAPRSPAPPTSTAPGEPNRRQRKLLQNVSTYLGQPVDHALEGFRGDPKRIAMVIGALIVGGAIAIVGIIAGSMPIGIVGAVVITASAIGLPLVRRSVPICWVAVQGDDIQVIDTVRNANNSAVPAGVSFVGTRADVAAAPGSSAVQIGPVEVTFVRSRARAMAILVGDRP